MANETEILIVNGVEYTLIDSTAVHTVDSGLSTSSSNPVKNSVITAEVNKKPTLLKFGPYTATLTGEYYTFPFSYIDIGGIAASHDGIAISFSSSSAFRPNSTLIAFKNEASTLNGVNVNAYSGTISKSTEIDSNTFVCILPTSGTSSGGTGYVKEGKANGLSGIFKGYCSTAAATVAKEVTCPEFTAADLEIGAIVFVTFSHTNSAAVASITLNVNGTGAKNIKYMRNAAESNLAGVGYLRANMTYRFVYNGEFWVCDTDYDSANSYNALVTQRQTKVASNAGTLYRYQWCLKDKAGDIIPYNNVNNAVSTYTKALTTVPFDPFKGIYWYMGTTTVAAGTVRNAVEWYEAYPYDCRYSLNINYQGTAGTTALTQSKSVYIKAKYTDAAGTAVLVPDASSSNYLVRSSIVQDLPTENPNTGLNNGERYIYIYVGSAYSLYQISLESINHVYTWSTRQNKMYQFTGIDIDVANDNGAFISIIYNNVTEDGATTIHFNHFRSNPTNYSDLIYSPDFIIALKKTIPVYAGSEGSSMLLTQGVLYGGISGLLSTSWTILFPDSIYLGSIGLVNGITAGLSYTNNKWVLTDVQPHVSPLKDYTDTSISTAIEALDAAVSGLGPDKTITALSETDGVISAEASDIAIAGKQVEGGATQYYGTCTTAAGTAAKVVTCPGFVLVVGARISVRFMNGSTSSGIMSLNVNGTGAKNCVVYLYNSTTQNVANRCSSLEVLEFVYDGTYWVTLTPYGLRNYANSGSRLSSANVSWANGGLQYFLATSVMTTGKPPFDAHILNMNWDNGTIAAAQLAVAHGADTHAGQLWTRAQIGTAATWTDWKEVPRLTSTPTNGQIMVSDQSTGLGLIKGGPALDATDTTKFLRHDGSWAEVGGGVAPIEDSEVFLSRSVNFGENKYKFPSLVGGTVAWNQLITASDKSKTTTPNGTATYSFTSVSCSIQANHIYAVGCNITYNGTLNPLRLYVQIGSVYGKPAIDATSANKRADWLIKPTANSTALTVGVSNVATSAKLTSADAWSYNNLTVIDLTLAFGPTIADYIYSLETATTDAGVNWFKQYFPKSYYPYNAGALVSVNPTGAETTGVNQWDEEWEVGSILNTTGEDQANTNAFRTKSYIPIMFGESYYFYMGASYTIGLRWYDSAKNYLGSQAIAASGTLTIPNSAAYLRFVNVTMNAYANNICINISNPLYNGTYYPYTSHSYPISPVELRGIPKLTDGKLAFDGDVRASDGTVTRKYREVNLTSFSGSFGATSNGYAAYINTWGITRDDAVNKSLCSKFAYSTSSYTSMPAYSWFGGSGNISTFTFILPSTVTSLAEANTWLQNNPTTVLIPLATPTTESSAALPVPQVVYDGGTESYVDERDVQMPVGQDATYMDATSAIGELMDSGLVPSSSGVSQTSGTFVLGGTGTTITSQWNYVKTGKEVTIYGGFANWMSSSTMTTLFGLPFTPAYSTPVHVSCYVLNVGKFDVVMKLNIDKTMTVECATLIGTNGTVTYIPVPSSTFAYYLIYLTAEIRYITNE